MSKYIDASELLEHLEACLQNGRSLSNLYDLSEIVRYVKSMPTIAAPRWHRVEDNPPKPVCYLTASPFFHGDDYSWLYRLAWWTEHGLMDFVQDAEKESGWYIWNNSQDRNTEIEPMYWMPIEPPKEIMNE